MRIDGTVGAVIHLVREGLHDVVNAGTVWGVVNALLELIDGDPSQYGPVGLGLGDVEGSLVKRGEGYLVTEKGKEYFRELWVSLDPLTEAYLVGAYMYFEAKRLKAKRTRRK
jgi:hypothetical protein